MAIASALESIFIVAALLFFAVLIAFVVRSHVLKKTDEKPADRTTPNDIT